MKKLINPNIYFGWTLIIGIVLTQVIITKQTFEMGRMAPFLALLNAVIFLPFLISAVMSVLNRDKNSTTIKYGIRVSIFLQIVLPLALPLFFDKELKFLGIFGLFLAGLLFFYKEKLELYLFILNCISGIVLMIVMLFAFLNYY